MIKKMRLSRGWSQEQLASLSGLSVRTIQRIERGQSSGLESLKCIASVLETDVSVITSEFNAVDKFLGTNPILPVVSVKETAQFYKDTLGFEIDILWHDPPYAVVARDQVVLEFGEGRKQYAGSGAWEPLTKSTLALRELEIL